MHRHRAGNRRDRPFDARRAGVRLDDVDDRAGRHAPIGSVVTPSSAVLEKQTSALDPQPCDMLSPSTSLRRQLSQVNVPPWVVS